MPQVISLVGLLCAQLGLCMLLPLGVSLYYGEETWRAFAAGALAACFLGGVAYYALRDRAAPRLGARHGLAVVGLSWTAAVVLGALPYYASGYADFTDAIFESASGLTTTGASIFASVEHLSKGILLWRAFTQWLGGLGFIVLALAVMPLAGAGGMQLFKAEAPNPAPERLAPRMSDMAGILWKIYLCLTALCLALLLLGGMDLFDALCHSLSTVCSGGFSTRDSGILAFNNPYFEWVILVFMILSGVNFSLYYIMYHSRQNILRNEELRWYLSLLAAATAAIFVVLLSQQDHGWLTALRLALFQVTAIITTTGYAAADFSAWPAPALAIVCLLAVTGASAGSTSGGPKIMRWLLAFKQTIAVFQRLRHPKLSVPLTFNRKPLDRRVLNAVWGFLLLYLAAYVVVTLLLAGLGLDLAVCFSAAIASLGNIGPGLSAIGPLSTYAELPAAAKWILSAAMVVGRLEIFTIVILFVPDFWRE